MEAFYKLFNYKTAFENITVFEREDAIATIKQSEFTEDILVVSKWEKNQKEFTKEIVDIFDWNGWSDNFVRYKL